MANRNPPIQLCAPGNTVSLTCLPGDTDVCTVLEFNAEDGSVVLRRENDGKIVTIELADDSISVKPAYRIVNGDKTSHFSLLDNQVMLAGSLTGQFVSLSSGRTVLVGHGTIHTAPRDPFGMLEPLVTVTRVVSCRSCGTWVVTASRHCPWSHFWMFYRQRWWSHCRQRRVVRLPINTLSKPRWK